MNKKLVANWKMNGTLDLLREYGPLLHDQNLIVATPSILIQAAASSQQAQIAAQDCSMFKRFGAFTGEVSAQMLKQAGAKFVILGHSERRRLLLETSEVIRLKIENALEAALKVIHCVSEDFESQISEELKTNSDSVWIAYEPLSAIGTGKTPSPEEIQQVAKRIKALTQRPVLYGGSVSSKNLMSFCCLEEIDGVLVGGASLKLSEIETMLLQIREGI